MTDDEDAEYLFAIGKQKKHKLFPVDMDGQQVPFLIDSGCTELNILDEKTYNTLSPKPTLRRSDTKIMPYGPDSQPLEVLGTFNTHLSAVGRTILAEIHVVAGNCGSILGEKSSIKLDSLRVGHFAEAFSFESVH